MLKNPKNKKPNYALSCQHRMTLSQGRSGGNRQRGVWKDQRGNAWGAEGPCRPLRKARLEDEQLEWSASDQTPQKPVTSGRKGSVLARGRNSSKSYRDPDPRHGTKTGNWRPGRDQLRGIRHGQGHSGACRTIFAKTFRRTCCTRWTAAHKKVSGWFQQGRDV